MKDRKQTFEAQEKELEQALGHFRQSVHAWSEAEFNRPRTIHIVEQPRSWRRAAAWALGCVLAAGSVSTGVYEHHHQQVLARMAAEREARQQQLLAAQRAAVQAQAQAGQAQAKQTDDNLLATVDKDVSRSVPDAMAPLAQLMEEDTNTNQ